MLEGLKRYNKNVPLSYNVTLIDTRKKVPVKKVLLHFFAGTAIVENILQMSFEIISGKGPAR